MMSIVKCNGKILFSPRRPGLKKLHRSFDNGVILKVDNGISEYYMWWLKKKYGISLAKPTWGTHITVVNDRDRVKDIALFNKLKAELNNSVIKINYNVNLQKVWQFWVLPVEPTPELQNIRRDLGLRLNFPFHITIGRDDHA